jgi:FtsZ-interacting cell division protein ZipA
MAVFTGVRITRTGIIFVAGIIVLAGLVGVGAWIAHNRGEQARHDATVKIAQQNLENQSKPAVSTTTSSNTNSGVVSTPDSTQTDTQTASTQSATPPALPTTGANPLQIIALSIVTLAVAYYATSRRAARDL